MNAPFPVSTDLTAGRLALESLIAGIERWSDRLDLINRKIIADPDGDEGARLESLILRAQADLGSHASRMLGVDVSRLDRARGVAL